MSDRTCRECGRASEYWRDQTLIDREGPRVVRQLYLCRCCGALESVPIDNL